MGLKQLEFGRLDSMASVDAGAAMEAYCDQIGKSDLRELTAAEFDQLTRVAIAAYRDALQTKLRDEAPF